MLNLIRGNETRALFPDVCKDSCSWNAGCAPSWGLCGACQNHSRLAVYFKLEHPNIVHPPKLAPKQSWEPHACTNLRHMLCTFQQL